jgi:hypothetical protein
MFDVLGAVMAGDAHFEWEEILSEHNGYKLWISVFRDAMKFDGCLPMNWHREPVPAPGQPTLFNGVRLPMTAAEMQQVADMLFCMLPTPKVLDLVWQQADYRFDPVINVHGTIVAMTNIHEVHAEIEKKIAKAGGVSEGLVASVGKYWVVSNRLLGGKFGLKTACNYGWHSSGGAYQAVTPGLKVWQSEGTQHNDEHLDPSQVCRLVYRMARLVSPTGLVTKVDLHDIAKDPALAPLINHNGMLKVVRQQSVPEPQAHTEADGSLSMPPIIIYPAVPPAEQDVSRKRPAPSA